MTLLYFTFCAMPYHDKTKGTHIIHCYLTPSEPTHTDSPGDERRAVKDMNLIVNDLVRENVDDDTERLLCDGEVPKDATPVFVFALGVAWDRENKMPSYKKMDYETLSPESKFAPVLSLGAEMYNYTFSVLKNRESKDREKIGAKKFKFDNITIQHGREAFKEYCRTVVKNHQNYLINKRRFDCERLKNGYCSPMNPDCPCCKNGRCVEV